MNFWLIRKIALDELLYEFFQKNSENSSDRVISRGAKNFSVP